MSETEQLKTTPLDALHRSLGGKMVPFAGYAMPVQYPLGVLKEHLHTRAAAGLFDVSHMGQGELTGADIDTALETLVPGDIRGLKPGHIRYTVLLNNDGGIIDDLMVTRPAEPGKENTLYLVVNAACKDADFAHIAAKLPQAKLVRHETAALLALQGPQAASVLGRFIPTAATMGFMTSIIAEFEDVPVRLFRSGYTGEDGYEISVPADQAEALARALLAQPEVKPAGLGARDTLRLEAGLCLYGHDIDERTTPIEAGLSWAIQKVRRPGGERAGGYPGASVIEGQLATGPAIKRVGLTGLEKVPVREGTAIVDGHGHPLGRVTSGTLGPTVHEPVAMAYLAANHALPAQEVYAEVRGKRLPMRITPMPFTPHRYHR